MAAFEPYLLSMILRDHNFFLNLCYPSRNPLLTFLFRLLVSAFSLFSYCEFLSLLYPFSRLERFIKQRPSLTDDGDPLNLKTCMAL